MTQHAKPSTGEYEKKKIAIAGVIDFNDANDIKYSKVKLFKHFGIAVVTGYNWFPIPIATGPRRGRPKADNIKSEHNSKPVKRTRSEDQDNDEIPSSKADSDGLFPPSRQNPLRNGGRDRKRLKAFVDDLTEVAPPLPISPPSTTDASSLPPPLHLLNLPKRGRGRPWKQPVSESGYGRGETKSTMGLEHVDMDNNGCCEV